MKKLLLALSTFAIAAPSWAGGWIGPYTISTIEIGDGVTYFTASANFLNQDGCASPGFILFDAPDVLMNRIVAAGLTAKAAGTPVRFLVSGCANGYIHANRIEVD